MDEYLDLIKIYYNEKLLLSTKDKDKKCNECQHVIQFKEIYGELILNCGDKTSSKCDDKIKIKLPIYKSDKDLLYFKNSLENSINWEVISKYIDINPKNKEDNIKIKEEYEKELKSLKDLFNKYNNNSDIIKKNYDQIKELKNKSKIIFEQIKLPENSETINDLKKEYIENLDIINKLTREIRNINDNIEYYYMIEDPKIISKDYNFIKNKPKKVKLTNEQHKTANYGILYIMYKINGDKQVHLQEMYKMKDELRSITNLFAGDDESFKSNIRARLRTGDINMVSEGLVNKMNKKGYYKISGKGIKYLESFKKEVPIKSFKNEPKVEETFKKADEVKWMSGNKELTGNIDKITDKSYMICCKPDGKMYRVKKELVSLNIVEEEEESEKSEEEVASEGEEASEEDEEDEESEEEEESKEEEASEEEEEEQPLEIVIGSKVKWTKGGDDFTGTVEKITDKSYKICCKPGKQSGDKSSTYMVSKELVSLV